MLISFKVTMAKSRCGHRLTQFLLLNLVYQNFNYEMDYDDCAFIFYVLR
jgi:hypothetical protein